MDIGAIYRRAWEVTRKSKILWFFGAIVAIFVGAGGSFSGFNSGGSSGSSSSTGSREPAFDPQPFFDQLVKQGQYLFSQVQPQVWMLLFLGILASVALGMVISYVARAWVLGSFITGIDMALDDKELSVKEIAKAGFKNFRSLLWLVVVPGLLLGLIIVAAVIGLGVVGLATGAFWLAVLLGLPIFSVLFIAFIIVELIQVWAVRLAAIEGLSGQESFSKGWAMVKKTFGDMVILGIVNKIASCCFGCLSILVVVILVVVVGLPAFFIVAGMFAVSPALGFLVGLLFVLIGMSILSLTIFITGAYLTFNYTTWNILYRQVKDKN